MKVPLNPASYCKARLRLPLAVLQALLESSAQAMAGSHPTRRWHGLRVYLTDGSGTLTPDTPALQDDRPINEYYFLRHPSSFFGV